MRRERLEQAGAGQAVTDFLGRAARCHAFRQIDRGNRFADMRNGDEFAGVAPQRGLLYLRFEIIRELAPHFALDGLTRFAIGDTKKTLQHLIDGDRIAVTGQGFRMRAA